MTDDDFEWENASPTAERMVGLALLAELWANSDVGGAQ